MDYAEYPAPAELRHLAKAAWVLRIDGERSEIVSHFATPDGCMEVIRRVSGRSTWHEEQPATFVAGLIIHPEELRLSGDSRFIGLRLYPWTWNALGGVGSRALVGGWANLAAAAPALTMPDDAQSAFGLLSPQLVNGETAALAKDILISSSVAELAERSGRSHRWLQRRFERHVGVSPRTYLRLLRFSDTLQKLPDSGASLARHAADHGFSDQAHMSREFRALAGSSVKDARKSAVGPFVPGADRRT